MFEWVFTSESEAVVHETGRCGCWVGVYVILYFGGVLTLNLCVIIPGE